MLPWASAQLSVAIKDGYLHCSIAVVALSFRRHGLLSCTRGDTKHISNSVKEVEYILKIRCSQGFSVLKQLYSLVRSMLVDNFADEEPHWCPRKVTSAVFCYIKKEQLSSL